ncbi:MAG: pyridoxine 5'-phosphate synthase [Rhodospirillales bacterium]|nr:pyridoxine 5'-phosphate synthase [Rhodospirillales bacterium]
MTKLSVNVNKVALLRNSRRGMVPSPAVAARIALEAGAAGVTVHPRPDRRHIRPDDVEAMTALLAEPGWRDREFNIEGNPFEGDWLAIVRTAKPDQCTLVPDTPDAFTSDHGWDVAANTARLREIVAWLHEEAGARVSLFMDPDPAQIELAAATGAERIELYTESYAQAFAAGGEQLEVTFARFTEAARVARETGLVVNAGHDLSQANLGYFLGIPGIAEVSIGHALIAEALEAGLATTVRAYLEVIQEAEVKREA